MKKKKRILIYCDFDCISGFSNVSKNIVDNLIKKNNNIEIIVLAINNYNKDVYEYNQYVKVIPLLNVSDENDKNDYYRRLTLLNLLYKMDFDILFCINDIELFSSTLIEHFENVKNEKLKTKRKSFKSIIYFPIDSEPREQDLRALDWFDYSVTYTEYAKNVISKIYPKKEINEKVEIIPHGVDLDIFHPKEITVFQKQMFLNFKNDKDPFIFGTVNRNSARKDLASLIIGFSIFKKNTNANAILYLHCNPNDKSGINIEILCARLGLEFGIDVVCPNGFNENKGINSNELNDVYNSFDCFITTTTAEGWGLSVTEAMACKKLVVCPNHTSLTEITNQGQNCINFLFNQQSVFVNDFEKIRFTTNPSEVANLMQIVYNLKNDQIETQEIVQTKIENAYNHVKENYNWDNIGDRFNLIIQKILK